MSWLKRKLVWICETLWNAFFNEPPRAPKELRNPRRDESASGLLHDRIHPTSGKLISAKPIIRKRLKL